jgi:ankyrin repeat protein
MASTSEDLFDAIEARDAERVRRLLDEEPAHATSRDANGVSALMQALYRLDMALVDAVKVHVTDLDVFEAAAFGDLDRLTAVLDHDPASVTVYSGDGFTPLHFAAFFGRFEAAQLLVARGAEVNAFGRGWMTGTAMHSAVSRSHGDVVRILLDAGADPNVRQSAGWTPLHSSAANGDLTSVRLLLDAGADPAAVNDEGRSVMDLAEEGADAGVRDAIASALQTAP